MLNRAATVGDFGATFEGPPCESPIEESVEYRLSKYAAKGTQVERQSWVETMCGQFRLDFLVRYGERRIAIECDGSSFHDDYRDEWRDALILGAAQVDEVIRFAGQDIHHRPDDCIYLLSAMHPGAFADRARDSLERLASDSAREADVFGSDRLRYFATAGNGDDDEITEQHIVRFIRRRRLAERQYWRKLYAAATMLGPMSLDEMIERDKATWMDDGR